MVVSPWAQAVTVNKVMATSAVSVPQAVLTTTLQVPDVSVVTSGSGMLVALSPVAGNQLYPSPPLACSWPLPPGHKGSTGSAKAVGGGSTVTVTVAVSEVMHASGSLRIMVTW